MKLSRKSILFAAGLVLAAVIAVSLASTQPRAAEELNKEEIQDIVRQYLMDNPEIVIEAIEAYQSNQEEIEQRKFQDTLTNSDDELYKDGLPFAGNPDADVVIVEFFDYNCGYCKRAMDDVNKVLEKDGNVKFIFREMPILSDSSNLAARYALAAHKQDKYFAYHQALMKYTGGKNESSLEKIGKDLGLDIERLRKDANSSSVRKEVEESLALSRKLGIRGTPAFIIGDTLAPGYMTAESMLEVIEQVRDDQG